MLESTKLNQIPPQPVQAPADGTYVKIKLEIQQSKRAEKALGKDEFAGENKKCSNYEKYKLLGDRTISELPPGKREEALKEVAKNVKKYGNDMLFPELKAYINSNPKFKANYEKFLGRLGVKEAEKYNSELKNGAAFPTNTAVLVALGTRLAGGVC